MAAKKKYVGQGILPRPGKIFLAAAMVAILFAIPVTLNLAQTQQDIRQEAAGKKHNKPNKNKQYKGNKYICNGGPYYCSNSGPSKECQVVCGNRPSSTPAPGSCNGLPNPANRCVSSKNQQGACNPGTCNCTANGWVCTKDCRTPKVCGAESLPTPSDIYNQAESKNPASY